MRIITFVTIGAAALMGAGPSLAQNATAPANTEVPDDNAVAANAVTTNETTVTTTTNETAVPAETSAIPADTTTAPPPAEEKKSFPWGVLGLLGLLGLIPRARR